MFDYAKADVENEEELEDDEAALESDRIDLAIKLNEDSATYECAVCGDTRASVEGPELFLADSWDLVCDECGRKYAPQLMALMDLGAAAEGYVVARDAAAPAEG